MTDRALPHLASDDLRPVQLAELYADLAATAAARAAYYGRLLAQAVAEEGVAALVGAKRTASVVSMGKDMPQVVELNQVGEEVRALVELEGRERDRAERLAREAIKLGVEASRVDVMRGYGRAVAEVARQFAGELGVDFADPATRRAAQRAVLAAQRSLGLGDRAPEEAGPALSEVERSRLLEGR